MKYRICKMFEVESGHMLYKHPDKCKFPHGHTRRVECVVESEDLDANEMVCDFKVFKHIVGKFIDSFDHAMCMNTDDPKYKSMKEAYGNHVIGFPNEDPTSEIMAETIFQELDEKIHSPLAGDLLYPVRSKLSVVKVRVWETSSSWAEYGE